MKSLNRTTLFLLAIIAILFITILTLIYLNYFPKNKDIPLVTPTPTAIPTATWQTYKNEAYGFEFQHPPQEPFFPDDEHSVMEISVNQTDLSYLDIIKQYNSAKYPRPLICVNKNNGTTCTVADDLLKELSGTVNGVTIYGFIVNGGESPITFLYFSLNNKNYLINLGLFFDDDALIYQIIQTFKFITPASPTLKLSPKPISTNTIKYNLPPGWETINSPDNTFQVAFDPSKNDAKIEGDNVMITKENITNNQYYSPHANSIFLAAYPYNNGSRHAFIENQLGFKITSQDKMPDFQEYDYLVAAKNCLILDGISYSQSPTIWGMCPLSSTQAVLFSSSDLNQVLQTLATFKIL